MSSTLMRDPLNSLTESNGQHHVAAPTVERHGDEFTVRWAEHGVELEFTGIHESSDGPHAVLSIRREGEEVHWSKLGLASSRSRDGIVKLLERSAADGARVPWPTMVDRAARAVWDAVREGEPARPLKARLMVGPRYLVEPILPLGVTSISYGPPDVGKGWLAMLLAVGICTGAALPGGLRVCQRGRVMWLDYETSEDDAAERLHFTEGALGVSCGDQFMYRRMVRPLADEASALRREIARSGIGSLFLDSLGPAAPAGEAESSVGALSSMNALRSFGVTALALGHIAKGAADQRTPTVYGSTFYTALARSCWEIRRSEDEPDDLVMAAYNRKSNSSQRHPALGLRFTFAPSSMRVTASPLAESPELLNRVTVRQRLRTMLSTGALTAEELAEATSEPEATIRKTLARMVKAKEAVQLPGTPLRWGLRA